jgi:hypothetical protein
MMNWRGLIKVLSLQLPRETTGNLGQESWYCGNIANTSLEQYQNIIQLDVVVVAAAAVLAAVVDATVIMNE